MVGGLARAGLPPCPGEYMATSWRYPLSHYVEMFRSWVHTPMPDDLLRAEIFLDVRPVYGDLDVASLDALLVSGGHRGIFLVQMARATITFRPPRVIFGRIRTDHGELDIKHAGTGAIVLLARLYALAAGTNAHSTLLRLQAADRHQTLSASAVAHLTDAYRFLTGLRLRSQIAQARAGRAVDNRVRVADLSDAERRQLLQAIRRIRVIQQITAERYHTHAVT